MPNPQAGVHDQTTTTKHLPIREGVHAQLLKMGCTAQQQVPTTYPGEGVHAQILKLGCNGQTLKAGMHGPTTKNKANICVCACWWLTYGI